MVQCCPFRIIMGCAIDLDRQPPGMAVEVEYPGPHGMLAPEAQAEFFTPDSLP